MKRLLFTLASLLVCVSLIRAANHAGSLSLMDLLIDLQSFSYSFDTWQELVDFFMTGEFLDGFVGWDTNLTGLEGFFINIRNVVMSFFATIGSIFVYCLRASWDLLLEFVTLFASVFRVLLYIFGYA